MFEMPLWLAYQNALGLDTEAPATLELSKRLTGPSMKPYLSPACLPSKNNHKTMGCFHGLLHNYAFTSSQSRVSLATDFLWTLDH